MDIITFISGLLTGSVGVKLLEKVVDFKAGELADNRRQKKFSRFELSTEVIKIINEGSTKNWLKKSNDQNYINFIARQIELEDPELDKKFTKLISRWNVCADKNSSLWVGGFIRGQGFPAHKVAQFEEIGKFVRELQSELTQLDKEISQELKKWRK